MKKLSYIALCLTPALLHAQVVDPQDKTIIENHRDNDCVNSQTSGCAKTRAILPMLAELEALRDEVEALKLAAPVDPVTDAEVVSIQFKSFWGSNCTQGPVSNSAVPGADGWTAWSPAVFTSEWDGAPWSCLQTRTYSEKAENLPVVSLKSAWGSCGGTSTTVTSVPEGSANGWSSSIYTSEWDGAPWSCLSAKIEMKPESTLVCEMEMTSDWAQNCGTAAVTTSFKRGSGIDASEKSDALITSEWDGAPWSCLTVQLTCN